MFDKGEEGEQKVAEALGTLTSRGCHVLHDRNVPALGGTIDHILVGPTGVIVINAKN